MTALTAASIVSAPQASAGLLVGTTDFPIKVLFIRVTTVATTADTLALSSYFTTGILSVHTSRTGAQVTTNTFSGTTITFAGYSSGTETHDMIVWGY